MSHGQRPRHKPTEKKEVPNRTGQISFNDETRGPNVLPGFVSSLKKMGGNEYIVQGR